ncbi:MAG: hypothetical protein PHQ86_06430 [Dehalococcoidales bacterium]|nr:hypothetical protein [Dehalococcoidales bacterium]
MLKLIIILSGLLLLAGCTPQIEYVEVPPETVTVTETITAPPVTKHVDRWHKPVIVTVNQTVYEELRVPEYPLHVFHTIKEFNKILYDSMSIPLFNYWDGQEHPDCDNYALQAYFYGISKGKPMVWAYVDRNLYDKIFQGQLVWTSTEDAHMIAGMIMHSKIYYADYTFPIFSEDGEVVREQRWFIVEFVPLD